MCGGTGAKGHRCKAGSKARPRLSCAGAVKREAKPPGAEGRGRGRGRRSTREPPDQRAGCAAMGVSRSPPTSVRDRGANVAVGNGEARTGFEGASELMDQPSGGSGRLGSLECLCSGPTGWGRDAPSRPGWRSVRLPLRHPAAMPCLKPKARPGLRRGPDAAPAVVATRRCRRRTSSERPGAGALRHTAGTVSGSLWQERKGAPSYAVLSMSTPRSRGWGTWAGSRSTGRRS